MDAGMKITSQEDVEKALKSIGFYRLRGYSFQLYDNAAKKYVSGTKLSADRSQGSAVDGLANAQAGDLICYSGHVALYIGNGQIVHASTAKTGIIVSNADYKKVLAVRRIF